LNMWWNRKNIKKITLFLCISVVIVLGSLFSSTKWLEFDTHGASTPAETYLAKSAIKYLKGIQGKVILSGQHDFLEDPDLYVDKILETTGELPVLHGYELGAIMGQSKQKEAEQREAVVKDAIAWSKSVGIVMMTYHAAIPGTELKWDNVKHTMSQADFDQIVTPGTDKYNALIEDIDRVAVYLREMQDAGVPVLWRPYHEMNGDWFWWGNKNNYAALWNIMYDRMTNVHHLSNLVWVWCANAPNKWSTSYEQYYPGPDKVDVLVLDIYDKDFQQKYYDDLVNFAKDKLIAIGENGELPDPSVIAERQSQYLWFMTWGEMIQTKNTNEVRNEVYHDEHVMTRSERAELRKKNL
jgi:mannan endo-1,4-beta-mannosidase